MFKQGFNALLQCRRGGRAARTGPLHAQKHLTLIEAAINYVAAIIGHRRADAGFDEFLYLLDNFSVGRVVLEILIFGRNTEASGAAGTEKRHVGRKMVKQYAEHIGLQIAPVHAGSSRHRNEIAAKEEDRKSTRLNSSHYCANS